jgi:hypothetical protein
METGQGNFEPRLETDEHGWQGNMRAGEWEMKAESFGADGEPTPSSKHGVAKDARAGKKGHGLARRIGPANWKSEIV